MAKLQKDNPLEGDRGLGQQLVFKKYANGTVVTAYPDMSKVKRTQAQEAGSRLFKEVEAYAKQLVMNPQRKAAFAATCRRARGYTRRQSNGIWLLIKDKNKCPTK